MGDSPNSLSTLAAVSDMVSIARIAPLLARFSRAVGIASLSRGFWRGIRSRGEMRQMCLLDGTFVAPRLLTSQLIQNSARFRKTRRTRAEVRVLELESRGKTACALGVEMVDYTRESHVFVRRVSE